MNKFPPVKNVSQFKIFVNKDNMDDIPLYVIIQSDYYRYKGETGNWLKFLRLALKDHSFMYSMCLGQFLNVGSQYGTPAIIGDNVYFGPFVSLVENVKIGNNVTIGAGAVVTKSIPDNATAAGVPVKVLNYDNPGRFSYRNVVP